MQEKDSEKLLNKIWWQIYAGVYFDLCIKLT